MSSFHRPSLLILAVLALAAGESEADFLPATLVPANSYQVQDSSGFMWGLNNEANLYDRGGVGFGHALDLYLNGSDFVPGGRLRMTPDGREFVAVGQSGTTRVLRRTRIDPATSTARVIDTFSNLSTSAVTLQISLQTGYNQQSISTVGESGGALAANDSAAVVQLGGGTRTLVFVLADPRSRDRPTIMSQHNHALMVSWNLTIPPGQTQSVMSLLSLPTQVPTDARARTALFRQLRSRDLLADCSPALRRSLVGWRGRGGFGGSSGPISTDDATRATSLPGELLEMQQSGSDLLILTRGSRLRGQATLPTLRLRGSRGEVEIAPDSVRALAAGAEPGQLRVFRQDGEVLAGTLEAGTIDFELATGAQISLQPEQLAWLLLRQPGLDGDDNEDSEAEPEAVIVGPTLVHTRSGEAMAVADDHAIGLVTAWGPITVPLRRIRQLAPDEEGQGWWLLLDDGSRLAVLPDGSDLKVQTRSFGEQTIKADDLAAIGDGRAAVEEDELLVPHLAVVGDQIVVGSLNLDALALRDGSIDIPLPPTAIRLLVNAADDPDAPGTWRAEGWQGELVVGVMNLRLLPVGLGASTVLIPQAEVLEVRRPTAVVDARLGERLSSLIAALGDPSWSIREAASRDLIPLVEAGRSLLEDARRRSSDPEVRLRLERLLEGN